MATKDVVLRKKLIKEASIALVVLVVLTAGGFLLSNYDDDAQTEMHNKDTESQTMRSQHDAIKQELGEGVGVSTFYDTYIKNHNPDYILNREAASNLLSTLREKNHLANLSVTISPISDVPADTIHLKSGTLTKSDVQLTFEALTDNSIYGFIESLQRYFPGMVVIKQVKFSRKGELTSAVVVGLGQHKLSPLVSGEIDFLWLGIRPAEETNASGTPPSAGGVH